jgi:hypothetical protein
VQFRGNLQPDSTFFSLHNICSILYMLLMMVLISKAHSHSQIVSFCIKFQESKYGMGRWMTRGKDPLLGTITLTQFPIDGILVNSVDFFHFLYWLSLCILQRRCLVVIKPNA